MNRNLHLPVKLASLLILIALLVMPGVGWGQISITATGTPFTENFNTLALTGTSSAVPTGWSFLETGSGANTTYSAGTGSANTGDTYSFGAASATDRAFGTLLSGSVTSAIGASFTNNTGGAINELAISYIGEQWRLGTASREDRLDFQYSLDATSLSTGAWVDVNLLDFVGPVTTGALGALDGNATANRTAKSYTITGLNIANGSTFWIRFSDFNASNSDDGLAVDDWSLTAIGASNPTAATPTFSPLAGTFYSAQNVTLASTTENSTIYYTTDGSDPDDTDTPYTVAIPVNSTTTIKAIAYATGYDPSEIATATYTIVTQFAVTFYVDMSNQTGFTTVDIAGSFNDWGNPGYVMTDAGSGIYTFTTGAIFTAGQNIEFKFRKDGQWATSEPDPNRTYTVVAGPVNEYHAVYGAMAPAAIGWANLQWPDAGTITAGGTYNVYARVYMGGVTEPAGPGANISAWIGYSTTNTNPNTWSNWVAASFNENAGNNDEYMANIAAGLTPGTYYYASRFQYSDLEYVYGGYSSGGGNFWNGVDYVSGVLTVNYVEPTAHVTNLNAIANSSSAVTVSWDDSDATGYLIKGSLIGFNDISNPIDGVFEADGGLIKNIASGVETWQFTGLASGTIYYFKVYPYNGSGTMVNYYIAATVPQVSAVTPSGPNVLQAGDIAILQINSATLDRLAFITFVELNPGTVINFTDNGFTSATAVRTGEGFLTYTAPATIPAGTVISWNNGMAIAGTGWNSNNPSNFALAGGDQLFVYQGTWGTNQTLVYGVSLSPWITSGSGSSTTSYLPSALSNNIDAFAFSTSVDNAYYSGTTNGTQNVIRSLVAHHLNWTSSSSNQGVQSWIFTFGNATTLNGAATLLNLTVFGSESLTLGSVGALTVNGSLLNSGTMTVQSGGSLITNGTVTGTATVQKNISDTDFHLFTLPVNQSLPASPTFIGYYVDDYIEANGEWTRLVDADILQPLRGYSIANESGAVSLEFSGNLFTGNQLFSGLSYTPNPGGYGSGWNLIGNPFPSAIDLDLGGITYTGLNGFVYVWNGTQFLAGPTNPGGYGTLTGNIIPSSQGFFVRTTQAGASFTLPNAARVHSDQAFYKNTQEYTNVIGLKVIGNNTEDNMLFVINPQASAGFDQQFDAFKLFGNNDAPQLYTVVDGENTSISALPSVESTTELPVMLKVGVDGAYTLTVEHLDTFLEGTLIYLTDNLTGLRQDLRQNPVYAFNASVGDDANRFKLSFATLGIGEQPGLNIGVYAVDGQIRLLLPEAMKGTVNITNLSGQALYSRNFSASGELGINASFPAGVYLVSVVTAQGTATRKVFVN